MAVFDASALVYFLAPEARGPIDPRTQKPVTNSKQRIDHQIQILGKRKERIVIPTPALREILVYADNASEKYLQILRSVKSFQVTDFDILAAIELVHLTRFESTREAENGVILDSQKTAKTEIENSSLDSCELFATTGVRVWHDWRSFIQTQHRVDQITISEEFDR